MSIKFSERMTLDELQSLHGDTLVNRREAATFLGLSYSTLCFYASHARGGPDFVRLGKWTVRYRMEDLRKYAAKGEHVARYPARAIGGEAAK